MAFSKVIQYQSEANFLESEIGLITKTYTGEQAKAVERDDRKLILAGSIYPTNDADAKGIVFETVDVTYDEAVPISVIVAGRVFEERLPDTVDAAAKTALEALGIKFVTTPDTNF